MNTRSFAADTSLDCPNSPRTEKNSATAPTAEITPDTILPAGESSHSRIAIAVPVAPRLLASPPARADRRNALRFRQIPDAKLYKPHGNRQNPPRRGNSG